MENDESDGMMVARGTRVFWGLLFLLMGAALLANVIFRIDFFSMRNMWPFFVLIPGLCLESAYFTARRAPGLLIPGGILTVIALLFFFETATRWRLAEYTWPVYIAAVSFGFFQFYLATGRRREILVIATILAIVAGTSMFIIVLSAFISFVSANAVIPVALILIGAFLLFTGFRRKRD